MSPGEHEAGRASRTILRDRRFLTCPKCGWVHYVMTPQEKAASDQKLIRLTQRYQLSEEEQALYQSAVLQCLRCESPAHEFHAAQDVDLDRAEGHIVTPVFVEAAVGTN